MNLILEEWSPQDAEVHSAVSGPLSLWDLAYMQLPQRTAGLGPEAAFYSLFRRQQQLLIWEGQRAPSSQEVRYGLVPPKRVSFQTIQEPRMEEHEIQRGPESCPKSHSKMVTGPGRADPGRDVELPAAVQPPLLAACSVMQRSG